MEEPLEMFATGSHTLEIRAYRLVKDLSKGKCIQSEHFTVGGYDWMIEYYPQGLRHGNDDYLSFFVKLLSTSREVQAKYSFSMLEWDSKKWSTHNMKLAPTDLYHFKPSKNSVPDEVSFMNKKYLEGGSPYLKDDALTIKCTLYVLLPAPAPAPKQDQIPFGFGFHTDSYGLPNLPRQPTVRIYCEADKDLSLTTRKGVVVLAPADSSDQYQHWIRDMSYGDSVKDSSGYPAIALVNSVTGEALKTPDGENEEVSLVAYKPNNLEDFNAQQVKWSTDFKGIRIKDRDEFYMTALPSPKLDGAKIVVKKWENTPVQHWNIVPYNSKVPYK